MEWHQNLPFANAANANAKAANANATVANATVANAKAAVVIWCIKSKACSFKATKTFGKCVFSDSELTANRSANAEGKVLPSDWLSLQLLRDWSV